MSQETPRVLEASVPFDPGYKHQEEQTQIGQTGDNSRKKE
jgi:hypothetical protein